MNSSTPQVPPANHALIAQFLEEAGFTDRKAQSKAFREDLWAMAWLGVVVDTAEWFVWHHNQLPHENWPHLATYSSRNPWNYAVTVRLPLRDVGLPARLWLRFEGSEPVWALEPPEDPQSAREPAALARALNGLSLYLYSPPEAPR